MLTRPLFVPMSFRAKRIRGIECRNMGSLLFVVIDFCQSKGDFRNNVLRYVVNPKQVTDHGS